MFLRKKLYLRCSFKPNNSRKHKWYFFGCTNWFRQQQVELPRFSIICPNLLWWQENKYRACLFKFNLRRLAEWIKFYLFQIYSDSKHAGRKIHPICKGTEEAGLSFPLWLNTKISERQRRTLFSKEMCFGSLKLAVISFRRFTYKLLVSWNYFWYKSNEKFYVRFIAWFPRFDGRPH